MADSATLLELLEAGFFEPLVPPMTFEVLLGALTLWCFRRFRSRQGGSQGAIHSPDGLRQCHWDAAAQGLDLLVVSREHDLSSLVGAAIDVAEPYAGLVVTPSRDDVQMASQQDITNFVLRRFGIPLPPGQPPSIGRAVGPSRPPTSSAEECAKALLQDEEFRALQLGTWLNTPDGTLISAAVEKALPAPYGYEAKIIADGLRQAAEEQRRQGLKRAGIVSGVGALVLLLTALSRSSG